MQEVCKTFLNKYDCHIRTIIKYQRQNLHKMFVVAV